MKCKECFRFDNDVACMGASEDDDATDCIGFIDVEEENVMNAFRVWLSRGEYSRDKIMKLCDEFEESDLYKMIKSKHK